MPGKFTACVRFLELRTATERRARGFILGSDERPALEASRTTETEDSLCLNMFRPQSGKSNMPWNGSGASSRKVQPRTTWLMALAGVDDARKLNSFDGEK